MWYYIFCGLAGLNFGIGVSVLIGGHLVGILTLLVTVLWLFMANDAYKKGA